MPSQPDSPSAPRRERRQFPRHAVDTRATLHLIDIGVGLSGSILNLSLGGCLIRMDQRFPTGIFRRIEIEFFLEGMPFRLPGVTQAIHDRRNVGIRFVGLSERKREQLVQLIREIEASVAPDEPNAAP